MVFSIISTTLSIMAILMSVFVYYENYLKRFNLFVSLGKTNPWANTNDVFILDLIIYLCNLGTRVGFIEEISIKIENRDNFIKMKPHCFLEIQEGYKILRKENWNSFLLFGKKTFSKNIQFIPNDGSEAKLDLIEEGTKKAILYIKYKENPKSSKYLTYSEEFFFDFKRNEARGKLLPKKN